MPVIKVQDRAQEFRITIEGRLAGDCVKEVAGVWAAALGESLPRKITVDISLLTGYDASGQKLLRQMEIHGTHFAAGTPESLVHLAKATASVRGGNSVLPEQAAEPRPVEREIASPLVLRAVAGK